MITVSLQKDERDMVLLALAITARLRPGFDQYLREIASKFGDDNPATVYDAFKATEPERR